MDVRAESSNSDLGGNFSVLWLILFVFPEKMSTNINTHSSFYGYKQGRANKNELISR